MLFDELFDASRRAAAAEALFEGDEGFCLKLSNFLNLASYSSPQTAESSSWMLLMDNAWSDCSLGLFQLMHPWH